MSLVGKPHQTVNFSVLKCVGKRIFWCFTEEFPAPKINTRYFGLMLICQDVETDSFPENISLPLFFFISIAWDWSLTFIPTSKVKIAEKEIIRINSVIKLIGTEKGWQFYTAKHFWFSFKQEETSSITVQLWLRPTSEKVISYAQVVVPHTVFVNRVLWC